MDAVHPLLSGGCPAPLITLYANSYSASYTTGYPSRFCGSATIPPVVLPKCHGLEGELERIFC